MNSVSKIDAENNGNPDQPDIILGADWDERARQVNPDEEEAPQTRSRRWISLNRSPLARKIITFNLLALVVLVGGVLYLNQFREGLVGQREHGLTTETQLIAKIFEARLEVAGAVALDASGPQSPMKILQQLDIPREIELFVFDPAEVIVASTIGLNRPASTTRQGAGKSGRYGTFITDMLNGIWESVSGLFGPAKNPKVFSPEELARKMSPFALAGKTGGQNITAANGDLLFAVSAPILRDGEIVGALVMTTASGQINQMARNEREQVLQMFVIAILVSIGLSLVLAGTIANPLRDLAAAAEIGKTGNARKVRPKRVRIPDMTGRPDEIGRLSGAFRGMVAALYDRIDSNEQFAADVSHEIKNPLSSLRSAVETLRMAKNDVQRAKLLEVIEHDVRRLDRLVSDISNASRLDSELVKEQTLSFDLIHTLQNIADFQSQQAHEIGAEFFTDLPDGPVIVSGLEGRLAQVFVNLLTNALSFCREGDAVKIWARKREDRVLVVVEDTGPGIPESAVTKIFDRFYSERPDDFGNHSGLGLAISQQIVEAHGGVIWAENIHPTAEDVTSEPLGARFVVGLPV